MTFLSTVLPGIREVRAPLVSGVLWLIFFLLVNDDLRQGFLGRPDTAAAPWTELVTAVGPAARSAAFLGAAYMLGLVTAGISTAALRALGRVVHRGLVAATRTTMEPIGDGVYRAIYRRPRWITRRIDSRARRYGLHQWPLSPTARALAADAISTSLTRKTLTGTAVFAFPTEAAVESLPHTAPQLAQTSPLQYQEFDRARAEVELRLAVVPGLLALAAVIDVGLRAWWFVGALVVATALLGQAVGETRRANDLLASALYLDLVKIPLVEATIEGFALLDPKPSRVEEQIAAMVAVFNRRSLFEEADIAFGELVGEYAESEGAFDAQAAYNYLRRNDPAEAQRYRLQMRENFDVELNERGHPDGAPVPEGRQ